MSRDQRINDNFALSYAQKLALESKQALLVLFNIDTSFPNFNSRNAFFMFENLVNVEQQLLTLNISMVVGQTEIDKTIEKIIDEYSISAIVTDFSPLKISKSWLQKVQDVINIPLVQVDAHNIIPCWITSNKQEYSARTIRPKVHKLLDDYFTPLPKIEKHINNLNSSTEQISWGKMLDNLKIDTTVQKVDWINPGEEEAIKILQKFIQSKIANYDTLRNDPSQDALSNLSPYLHYGHLSAQRIAWEISSHKSISKQAKDVFLEELIVRRELADNYCFYNENYDAFAGFHKWAQESLQKHLIDKREYDYSLEEFEKAKTHDDLWNAAQLEMVRTGKMHGYLRMYWAKKILEWTETPSIAQKIAIELNDKYELDGRDPNGYTGIAWSIGGVHDRPWGPERPIFGMVRYMNYNGAKRKFNIPKYIQKIEALQE